MMRKNMTVAGYRPSGFASGTVSESAVQRVSRWVYKNYSAGCKPDRPHHPLKFL